MGKRSSFERIPRDFYPTPYEAVVPLLAHLPPRCRFVEPCAGDGALMDVAGALAAEPGMKQQTYIASSAVRRLTPMECERLQGFPDGYTLVPVTPPSWADKWPERVKYASDSARYKALGNSMAVPVMRWIGERIARVEALHTMEQAA